MLDARDVHMGGAPCALESVVGEGDPGRSTVLWVGISLHEPLPFEPVDERSEPGGAQAGVLGHVLHADAVRAGKVGVNERVVRGQIHVCVVA